MVKKVTLYEKTLKKMNEKDEGSRAWEFLRRNQDYIKQWEQIQKDSSLRLLKSLDQFYAALR